MKEEFYLSDPCGASSLPFWKTETVTVPDCLKIIRDDEYRRKRIEYTGYSDEQYFKLIHFLRDIQTPVLPDGFILAEIGIADFARHIQECYAEGGILEADLQRYTVHPVYDPSLWLAIKDKRTEKTAATGIAEFDARIGEGILEWIQVSPEYRNRGIGMFVVNELLCRMQGKADFVTVSGNVNNTTNPLSLYEGCGFSGKTIWHVLRKD